MANEFVWRGASGRQYTFWSYQLPFSCDSGQNGNYIFTKIVNNSWVPIYIGEGDINERVNDPTHSRCSMRKGATHIHTHLNSIERNRKAEEEDLLGAHPEAYVPNGCNEKEGG